MNREEILTELLNQTEDETQNIILSYIIKTNQYSKYIEFIAKLSAKQQEELTRKIVKTKMAANALQMQKGFEDMVVNKDNWFVWMRYLDVTEDRTTPHMNFIRPVELLKKIGEVLSTIKDNDWGIHSDFPYLIKRFNELKVYYLML